MNDGDDIVRGADPLEDGFEVGYDEAFETSWYRVAIAGRFVMLGFVLICLAGLLGRGPFSHATAATGDGALRVDYEPVARNGTPTLLTLHVGNPGPLPRVLSVRLTTRLAEPMGLERSLPRPVSEEAGGATMTLRYTVAPEQPDALVRLALQPTGLGPVPLAARLEDGPELSWSQFVVP